jgi:peptidoglycan/xylan/chitin deacetylase (PgdA/CDA1 family)
MDANWPSATTSISQASQTCHHRFVEYGAERLRERRARRARVLRRRRRIGAALVLLVVTVAVIELIAATRSDRSAHSTVRATSLSAVPTLGAQAARGSRLQEQLAAVKRLAAYGLPLFCGGRSRRLVALTFDDGPGPYTTLAINKLRQAHLHATFFLVGKQLAAYPGRARLERPLAAVGDHTMTHPFLPALTHAAMIQEIVGARRLIERAADQPVVLFRPPYEGMSAAIEQEVRSLGLLEVLWNVDSGDSLGANYAGIERNVIAGLHPGSIILMHENHGQTIRALPTIFAALRRDRLRAVTVPELVTEDPPSPSQLRAGERRCGVARGAGNGG